MRKFRLLAFASLAALGFAAQAQAAGFYLQEQSVRGTGRAYSGEVADQGVESLWWNPAAIARSGRQAYVGAHGVFIDANISSVTSTVTYPGGTTLPAGGEVIAHKPITPGLVPNMAVSYPVGDRFALGLSVAAPFNFTTKYRPRAFTRYDAQTSTLRTVDIQMTGAMKVTDWLDVGVSADAEYMKARLSNADPNLSPLLPDASQTLKGHGWDWGWSVGAQGHFDKLTVGASYRSQIKHTLDGSVAVSGLLGPLAGANATTAASAGFTTPWIATLGARYALTDRLTLNGQIQRTGWAKFKAITVNLPTGSQVQPQDYKSTTSGGVGVDYAATPQVTLRAGMQYDPTPTPDIGRTARVPDGDRYFYGVGATVQATEGLSVEGAFGFIHFKDTRIDHTTPFYAGTPAATSTHVVGDEQGKGYILSLGLRSTF